MKQRITRQVRKTRYVLYKETLIDLKEHIWTFLGAFTGIALIGLMQSRFFSSNDNMFLIGSFGASSVLIYGIVNSPLAQPRNLIGGHLISAFVGVSVHLLVADNLWLAAALSVSVSIVLMQMTKTLHPPGGATALIANIGSPKIHALGYYYVLSPVLNPQFTNSSQISYTYKGTTATLSYSKTRNVMTQVTEQNDATKETFVMERNLDNQTVYSLNIYAPIKLAKWWNLNSNTQVFNMGFTADVLGERLKASQTVFQVNVDNQITITKTLGAELSSWYMSPLQYGIFKIRNSPYVNAGLKKLFENNKLSLKLNLNDIFNSMRNRGSTNFANMDFNFNNKWESRVLNFSLSYRFGSKDVKPERRRSTGLESEANRMKN